MDIGQKIKVLRAEKGLNQQQLADLINKTRTLISHIETTSKVNFYTLEEISKALNVDVSYFTKNLPSSALLGEANEPYAKLEEKIKQLDREVELLNEIVSHQKEIIKQLKQKSK